jgi:hypothetical protein
MPIANSSADQERYSAETGVKLPKISSGMNKLPPADLNTKKNDDRSRANTADHGKDGHAEILGDAKKRFSQARKVESDNRREGVEDLKFKNGEQWSQADATSRASEGRPCITENRLPTFANQITNDQRQNRPSIVISPMGDKASKKDAKILRGMIRAIERDSSADVAYDTGFQSAVDNGWGYWRVMSEYESEKSVTEQVLVIRPLFNPMNVYLDPARTPFMLDAKWGFISEMLPKDEFKREHPDASMTPWGETGIGDDEKDWISDEEIRVAEYYYFDHVERELVLLDNGHQGWQDELDELLAARVERGTIEVVARRTVQCQKLKWCKLTAIEIIEGPKDCDGQYIPIIECNGTILNINGKLSKKGIIRDAKGPQRMLNFYSTLETENVALQPKAPWIMEEGQVEGHEDKWQQANRKSFSYLLYKGTNIAGKPSPPPQRQPFQGPPAAILAAKQGTVEALKAVTGIRFDATMSERMQDESGRAIRELKRDSNLGAYHYIDNFGRALRNTGIVLCDLIPYKYDTKRIVSILDESGVDDRVMINPSMTQAHGEVVGQTPESAEPQRIKMFNPKIGRYRVTCTIGPSYATKRVEATESQMDFVRAMPQVGQLVADLIAKNSDWEGSEEFANRIAKSMPANLLTPSREDMSPQVQALIQALQGQLQNMGQQLQMMGKELTDRQKDRDVIYEQISKRFEAEILKIAAKMEEINAKREATLQGTVGRQLAEIAKATKTMEEQLRTTAEGASKAPAKPNRSYPGFQIERE